MTLNSFEAPFGKIGVGICYDIVSNLASISSELTPQRFPEMAMIAAREGKIGALDRPETDGAGCVAMIYPAAFNTTTGPMHWTLLQRSR